MSRYANSRTDFTTRSDGPTTRKWVTVPETCLTASNDRPNIARNLIHRPTNAAPQQSSENNLNFASEKESQCQ